ncbi:MAG: YiiX/YebB-like N1pC/P60 family cysteine hydrolase [Dysgonomonas sp.]
MLIKLFYTVLLFSLSATAYAKGFVLCNGDLIFQESCVDSNMSKAIKDVTVGVEGYNFVHVGIVWIAPDDSIYVIEATQPKVCVTKLQDYLYPKAEKECLPKSVVGRLKSPYQPLIGKALVEAIKLIGKDYDDAFDLKNDKYYCSELIYDIFLKANNNNPVFDLNTMTFRSKATGKFSPDWIAHFQKLGIAIPEGELGTNPGTMSRSEVIDILHAF